MALGQCRECYRRRETRHATRFGGGTYRRGGRTYHSSICAECAEQRLSHVTPGHTSTGRWSIQGLKAAFPEIKTEALERWQAALDERMEPHRARREARQ